MSIYKQRTRNSSSLNKTHDPPIPCSQTHSTSPPQHSRVVQENSKAKRKVLSIYSYLLMSSIAEYCPWAFPKSLHLFKWASPTITCQNNHPGAQGCNCDSTLRVAIALPESKGVIGRKLLTRYSPLKNQVPYRYFLLLLGGAAALSHTYF